MSIFLNFQPRFITLKNAIIMWGLFNFSIVSCLSNSKGCLRQDGRPFFLHKKSAKEAQKIRAAAKILFYFRIKLFKCGQFSWYVVFFGFFHIVAYIYSSNKFSLNFSYFLAERENIMQKQKNVFDSDFWKEKNSFVFLVLFFCFYRFKDFSEFSCFSFFKSIWKYWRYLENVRKVKFVISLSLYILDCQLVIIKVLL